MQETKPTLSLVRNTKRTRPIGVCLPGVDNTVHVEHLIQLHHRYPFASFGIRSRVPGEALAEGIPNLDWRKKMERRAQRKGVPLIAFLDRVRTADLLEDKLSNDDNGCPRHYYDELVLAPVDANALRADKVKLPRHGHFVFETPMDPAFFLESVGPNPYGRISFLFDVTAGTGVYRKFWPAMPPGCRIGATGGISQHNIGVVLANLAPQVSWISVDQGLHDSRGLFSLAAAEAVLRQVADYYAPDTSFP